MISVFLKEQKRYRQSELVELFETTEEHAVTLLKRLKEYGVLKAVKASDDQKNLSDLLEEDIEVADVEVGENEYFYVFTFVGVITIENRVLKCYPKYIHSKCEPLSELKQVLAVIEKYNSKEQIIKMYNDTSDSTAFNMLAVMLFLLKDYFEFGSYNNSQDVIETNGGGEILWDRTINETFAVLNNGRPIYPEIFTRKTINDDFDFFKRLHECILTRSSKELEEADLLELFDMSGVDISDEELDDFGDTEYILERITKELRVQFNTRKQLLLKTLYAYVSNSRSHVDDMDCFSMFGTNSFNLVWEKACAEAFGDQRETSLGNLNLPVPLCADYSKSDKLISIIDKPQWIGRRQDRTRFYKTASKTLIPDLLSIVRNGDEYQFIIFDAKYYNLTLEERKELSGQPGIESITKQYLYQLAYQKFIEQHKIKKIHNCFLMPTELDYVIDKGHVTLEMLRTQGLEDIKIRLLPAMTLYQKYLGDQRYDIEELKLDEAKISYLDVMSANSDLQMVAEDSTLENYDKNDR